MDKPEIAKLLNMIAIVDHRKITEDTVNVWHEILGHLNYEVAKIALNRARRDGRVEYLEPRHIIAWQREAQADYERKHGYEERPPLPGVPMPECREHGLKLLSCDPCCRKLQRHAEQYGLDAVPDYARREVFA